jgi:hypothetical protein
MTLAIGHCEASGVAVLDCVREVRPPFSPDTVVEEFATLLKSYGISRVALPLACSALALALSARALPFPRLCAALSPTRSASNGCGQRISPVGEADIPRETNSPPFAVLRMRSGPLVQAARAGLFCAAPKGTRWRWASGPRRKTRIFKNGFEPLQVLPKA